MHTHFTHGNKCILVRILVRMPFHISCAHGLYLAFVHVLVLVCVCVCVCVSHMLTKGVLVCVYTPFAHGGTHFSLHVHAFHMQSECILVSMPIPFTRRVNIFVFKMSFHLMGTIRLVCIVESSLNTFIRESSRPFCTAVAALPMWKLCPLFCHPGPF